MCGIVFLGKKLEKELYESSIQTLINRGPDDLRITHIEDKTFMFTRLSVMGLTEKGMQPFHHKQRTLIANGEIYNYKQIKSELIIEHNFTSDSDCEVLLPFYDQMGLDMFALLDAEFALVMYDENTDTIIAARDPLGIRPLFYGYLTQNGMISFASEVKALQQICDDVYPFPPGQYYINGQFVKYSKVTNVKKYSTDSFEDTLTTIRTKLVNAVVKRLDSHAPIGFLLSGGLDSSLVCSIAVKYLNKRIKTYSIGMDSDPIDLKYAKTVSDFLGTDHTEVRMSKEDVLNNISKIIYALETYDITTIRASIGMFILSKYIHENSNIKVLMTGEVSDELFGYKYTDYAPDSESFQMECKKRIDEIHLYDVLRADRCLATNSLEARVPFGDIDFASYVMRINPIMKMNKYRTGKYLLRKAFEGDFLPNDILYRDKAAFSDAVGHSMVDYIKEYTNTYYTKEEFDQKVAEIEGVKPTTKEALYYREIFDKHYPNKSHLIKGYWMPNKDWEGCNVDDPSARALSNYGDSGK